MPFNFKPLEIPDVILIEPRVFPDERGFFMEVYKSTDFERFGIKKPFLQDNHSRSTAKGIIRGLHYQKNPMAQGKLVRVLKGKIFDVAVDLRKGSPSYKKWIGVILSEDKANMLYVPEGFGHGFCTLSSECEVFYKCTNVYSPEHEQGIIWNDPELSIQWPVDNPILSEKDSKNKLLSQVENNFT